MAFNPSTGYNLVSSNDEASQFMGSLSGANNRGQSAMASAALRAKNHIDTAEKRAQLGAAGRPQQSSSRSNPWIGALSSVLGGAVKGFGQMGSTPVTNEFSDLGGFGPVSNAGAYGSYLDATAGTSGMGPLANGDVYGSFLNRQN